jgi:hypothetical protein
MALPPLELFSLKKRPPCCRVASSLFRVQLLGDCGDEIPEAEADEKKSTSIFTSILKTGATPPMQECKERYSSAPKKRHSMSHALHPALQILIALTSLAILIWPTLSVDEEDLDANDFDRTHIP